VTPDDSHCRDLVQRFDRERYLATLFAPTERRPDLWALYAFNVEVALTRERVSDPTIGLMRLQWWRDTLDGIDEGRVRDHPVARALAAALTRRSLTRDLFRTLLAAREADLDETPPASIGVLQRYASETAGGLAVLAAEALDGRSADTAAAARHVGIAWGLVGLMRAVPFHAQQRRVYLPADRLVAHGVAADDVIEGRQVAGLRHAVKDVVEAAAAHLDQARALAARIERQALPVLAQARLVAAHLRRLRAAACDPFAPGMHRPEPFSVVRLGVANWTRRY